jgi:1,4-dihydroxy-2-naphthoyl-CoA hydrolase
MPVYISHNTVRMHDTDMAGVIYFPRQFRFCHDALEDFVTSEGLPFESVFHEEKFVFLVVHCEADYLAPLKVGDKLTVKLSTEKIGTSSFTVVYKIFKADGTHVGSAKTTHVTLDSRSRKKIPVPKKFREILEKYLDDGK